MDAAQFLRARWRVLAVFLAAVGLVAFVGGRFTASSVGSWYLGLAKPTWTPPGSLIGIVWTVLYVLIALAATRTWAARPEGRGVFLAWFAANLLLNAGWSAVFFGLRRPSLAVAEIAVLAVTCAALVVLGFRRDRWAGWLFLPYLAWVVFAGVLNATIAAMN